MASSMVSVTFIGTIRVVIAPELLNMLLFILNFEPSTPPRSKSEHLTYENMISQS